MKEMNTLEFVRWLKNTIDRFPHLQFAFFVGAGCSVTSDIPSSSELVKEWLKRLKQQNTGTNKDFVNWAKKEFPGFDGKKFGELYGLVLGRLYPDRELRQLEIEKICANKDPGFGYAVLAHLISDPRYKANFNMVLTTNFDDMLVDALYLYTWNREKPLVITHEALASFVRSNRTKPTIIKIHGDAHLYPKNLEVETAKLDKTLLAVMNIILKERGLIFIGYGGNDFSIINILERLPKQSLPGGIFWVNRTIPERLKPWLEKRRAIWVNHRDFDELMVLIRTEFNLGHPSGYRYEWLMERYKKTFEDMKKRVEALYPTADNEPIKSAVEEASSDFVDWRAVVKEVEELTPTKVEEANKVYRQGLAKFPKSAPLHTHYARFLENTIRDYDNAERYYKRAIKLDPNNVKCLDDYAVFLKNIRKDNEKANIYYKRALEADAEKTMASEWIDSYPYD